MENYLPRDKESATRKRIDTILHQTKLQTIKLGMGDVIDVGDGFYLQVLYPPYPLEETKQLSPSEGTTAHAKLAKPRHRYSSNNGSLVMRIVKDGKGLALICGDVENTVLKELLRFQEKNMWTYNINSPHKAIQYEDALHNWSLQAEILVLPHHGSKNSFLPEFYETVNPQMALASSGRYNRFGFPAKRIQNYFKGQNKYLFTTAKEGHLTFIWNGKTLERQ
jgi:competence protein ComEC